MKGFKSGALPSDVIGMNGVVTLMMIPKQASFGAVAMV
jgi:hypothetical protein